MPKDEQISGAPIPMKIGETTYRARTLSDKDFDELNAWVRFKFLQEALDTISMLAVNESRRAALEKNAILGSSSVTFNSSEGSRIINNTVEGIAKVGWQMIIHYHPGLKFEEFLKEVEESLAANTREIDRVFIELNISDEEENKSEAEGDSDKEPKSN